MPALAFADFGRMVTHVICPNVLPCTLSETGGFVIQLGLLNRSQNASFTAHLPFLSSCPCTFFMGEMKKRKSRSLYSVAEFY